MAEEQDSQEKTEEPTQRKIDKSIEDGQFLTSKEMFVFTSVFIGLMTLVLISSLFPNFMSMWKSFFIFSSEELDYQKPYLGILKLIKIIVILTVLIGLPLLITSIITQFCVGGGINFSPKAFSFKGNKINPITGLKRMFSMQSLIELIKSILKVSLLGGISGIIIYFDLIDIIHLSDRSLYQALKGYVILFPKLTIFLLIALAIIAMIDFIWQKYSHNEKLKMSIKEVKDEMKDTDGSPEVKQKIRRLQNEISQRASQQSSALEDVKDASVVITNPTHFAVALKYEVGEEGAPVILAMGRGLMAEKIMNLANEKKINIFSSPLLARALYFTGQIGKEISEDLYASVAAILAYIFKIEKGEFLEKPEIEIPSDLQFDEYGNKKVEDVK